MIETVLKLMVRVHAWWVAGAVYEFRIIPRDSLKRYTKTSWDSAHHMVEGKNGGELLIPRTPVWFPEVLWKKWALIYRKKPRRR
jgi:hypothetical protein